MPTAAVQALQKSAELDPENPDTLFVLGQELLHDGDRAGAVAQWRKVIEINPEHGEALYNLSRQLAQSDPDESKRLQARFEALQAQKQIMDRAQTLGNFALGIRRRARLATSHLTIARRNSGLRRLYRAWPVA